MKKSMQEIAYGAKQPAHTKGEWRHKDDDPCYIMCGRGGETKFIARTVLHKGDEFTTVKLEREEAEANARRIVKAVNMHDELISETDNIKFYASTALKSLDNGSLSEVRGMLEGILEKSAHLLQQAEQK